MFKTKVDGENVLQRYKAKLVVKGYSQVAGIDFDETYAPVIRVKSVRCLFAIATHFDLYIVHADARNAFLNGKNDFELYIKQPEGFPDIRHPNKVLRLNKSLYGTKQAPRIWYLLLCDEIVSLGFEPCDSDSCIYYSAERQILLGVYVDDILILGKSKDDCDSIYNALAKRFDMEYIGAPTTFLGLSISRTPSSISIN